MFFAKHSVGAAIVILLTFVFIDSGIAQVWEQRSVLLTNDRVIAGQVQQQGENFRIKQNEGNEIRVERRQVAAIGKSIRDLYQYKLDRLPRFARGGDHSQLARWCLSVNLLAEAGEHYLLLTQSHPANSNQSVKQLGFEIKDKMLQQNDFRISLGLQPLGRPAATLSAIPSPTTTASPSVVTASGTSSDNKAAILGRVQARFAEQIQHILINRCGQAACHGHATKTPFRLVELGGRDASTQTQQNLDAVLRYISDDPQAKSVLIDYLTKTHATMNAPAIGTREAQLANEVANWVQLVQNPVVSAEAWAQPSILNPLTPGAPQLRQVPRSPATDPARENAEFPKGADVPTTAELDALDAQVRQLEIPVAATVQANDPFDPSEFNRQTARRD